MAGPLDHGLDLRLLRTLHMLLTECSVSRTATLLGQSQPSVSLTLKRLRELFNDPLLVRSGTRLVPTERGLRLAERAHAIVEDVDHLIVDGETFDPAAETRRMRIFAANCLGTFFMPRVAEIVRREAPHMPLDFCAITEEREIFSELEDGRLDLAIGNWPLPRENLRFAPLLETDIVLVVRPQHPLAGRTSITMAEYMELDHLSPTPHTSAAISPIDGRLAQMELKRPIILSVAEFTLVPHVLARTDLVFTSSRPFAEQMAGLMPFVIIPAPSELGRMKFYTLWHERSHRSPGSKWIRSILRRSLKRLAI